MHQVMLEVGTDAKFNVVGYLRSTAAKVREDVVVLHTVPTSPEFSKNICSNSKEEFAKKWRERGINSIEG